MERIICYNEASGSRFERRGKYLVTERCELRHAAFGQEGWDLTQAWYWTRNVPGIHDVAREKVGIEYDDYDWLPRTWHISFYKNADLLGVVRMVATDTQQENNIFQKTYMVREIWRLTVMAAMQKILESDAIDRQQHPALWDASYDVITNKKGVISDESYKGLWRIAKAGVEAGLIKKADYPGLFLLNEAPPVSRHVYEGSRLALKKGLSKEDRSHIVTQLCIAMVKHGMQKNITSHLAMTPEPVWNIWTRRNCTPAVLGEPVVLDEGEPPVLVASIEHSMQTLMSLRKYSHDVDGVYTDTSMVYSVERFNRPPPGRRIYKPEERREIFPVFAGHAGGGNRRASQPDVYYPELKAG